MSKHSGWEVAYYKNPKLYAELKKYCEETITAVEELQQVKFTISTDSSGAEKDASDGIWKQKRAKNPP